MTNFYQQKKLFLVIAACSLGSSVCFAPSEKTSKKRKLEGISTSFYIPLGILGSVVAGLGLLFKFSKPDKVTQIFHTSLIKAEIEELLGYFEETSENDPKKDFLKIIAKLKDRHSDHRNVLLSIEAYILAIKEDLTYEKLTEAQRNIFFEKISQIKSSFHYLDLSPQRNNPFKIAVKKAIIKNFLKTTTKQDLIQNALFEVLENEALFKIEKTLPNVISGIKEFSEGIDDLSTNQTNTTKIKNGIKTIKDAKKAFSKTLPSFEHLEKNI